MKVVMMISALLLVSTSTFAAESRLVSYAPAAKVSANLQKPALKAPARQKVSNKRGVQRAMEWQLQNPQLG